MPGGLYANIQKKRERIKAGSGEKMRKPGTKGAPTAAAFRASAKTAMKGKK
jgi:cysteine sulfinate desulfinase/cysteine desulfurase-like protein